MLRLLSSIALKDAKIFENHLNTVMLVSIGNQPPAAQGLIHYYISGLLKMFSGSMILLIITWELRTILQNI